MKSIIIIGDGMSDEPVERLGGRTPLMASKKPNIDRVAREGRVGLFSTIPQGMPKGSEVANLSVLGYDALKVYQGRAVVEAANMGVPIGESDVGLRCNLISVEGGKIKNHSAGHISTEEAGEIIEALDRELGRSKGPMPVEFHPGVSYRHLLVLKGAWASASVRCAPPHDHVGESVSDLLPRAASEDKDAISTAKRLNELIEKAAALLARHPVNAARKAAGRDWASSIWPWSPGRKPNMATFQERFGIKGAVISAVDLIKGLGRLAGMDVIDVPGATGLWDTNYEGKAAACLEALEGHDLVYVHVEASDEAAHAKDLDLKIRCIEQLDARLVGPILEGLDAKGVEAAIAVLPDHPTPVESGAHADAPVPVAIRTPGVAPDDVQAYDEFAARNGSLGHLSGDEFIKTVLGIK